jgi:hypothetical protein
MIYKGPSSVLLVLISGFGFIFAFVTVGSLISFLSYIPSSKVDISQIPGNFLLADITYCVGNDCDAVYSREWPDDLVNIKPKRIGSPV